MAARARMTMRCSTERQANTGALTPFGQPVTGRVEPLTSGPCYWQAKTERFIADGTKVAAIASHIMLMPLAADILEQDHVLRIKDRRGRVLKDGRLRVMTVLDLEDHKEISLEEYA